MVPKVANVKYWCGETACPVIISHISDLILIKKAHPMNRDCVTTAEFVSSVKQREDTERATNVTTLGCAVLNNARSSSGL
jgi:hypothetical protein